MLMRRVIPCLDVAGGRVVKGRSFVALRDVGDPVALAARYEAEGADEVVLLDITATIEGRSALYDVVRRAAERLSVPLTVGGGVRAEGDVDALLRAGADKVSVNSAIHSAPDLLSDAAARFGAQCVVASLDARRAGAGWEIVIHGGRTPTGRDAVTWAAECARRGAGEILLTSIDRDGRGTGYDLALVEAVARAVPVPVVASGGAGAPEHLVEALRAGADAVLVAGMLHDGGFTVSDLKAAIARAGIPVRETPAAAAPTTQGTP
jgi:imidazole glycerol-phosphate synthase subunit HisF